MAIWLSSQSTSVSFSSNLSSEEPSTLWLPSKLQTTGTIKEENGHFLQTGHCDHPHLIAAVTVQWFSSGGNEKLTKQKALE